MECITASIIFEAAIEPKKLSLLSSLFSTSLFLFQSPEAQKFMGTWAHSLWSLELENQ